MMGEGGRGGSRKRVRERVRERESERKRVRENGPSGAQQRNLCASARPSQAQRRVQDKEGGVGRGPRPGGFGRGGGGAGAPQEKGPGLRHIAGF